MKSLTDKDILSLEKQANEIRISIIESLIEAQSGHTAGPLDMADIFTVLYFAVLNHTPTQPHNSDRDRVILSNGHICPVLYATMAHSGYFDVKELKTLRKLGSRLQGHPHREALEGLETSSGPLGSGLSQALGMVIADRIMNPHSKKYFYCLLGDGELDCGQIWESAMHAGREKSHNLIAIVDRNGIQIDGTTETILPLEPLKEKFKAFNWHVIEVDGHSIPAIYEALGEAQSVNTQPSVIIAHTIPSKGVKAFERDYRWHGAPPGKGPDDVIKKSEQGAYALQELYAIRDELNNKK